ncbi:hypothetical protein ABL78_6486 [Leptomonas seymouri]|uniref:Uncharacterized protein n=1 Tax=Leptomonas seymouri TaxID=5684 RepID=A0A0N0P461_LEPSE|nr:hypothetical protein ABL78_6486 [Leptomonas seymouri]|eukprot:KPI84457.1 hypothetical protein ABL78_6486 [Leptomonas seymouri]
MGAECSSEVKESRKPQFDAAQREYQPVGSAMPSPVVSSFMSGSNKPSRRKYDDSLATDDDDVDRASYETGCSGRHSLKGFVPLNKVTRWLKGVPPPEKLSPVPPPDIWSNGEREEGEWIRTEGDLVNPGEEKWDAPHYVSALGIRSSSEQLHAKQTREKQRKAQAKAACR